MSIETETLNPDIFARKVAEGGLDVTGPIQGYLYASRRGVKDDVVYRCLVLVDPGDFVEQTAVTANPAAGVVSVDVKTFTGRGRVLALSCTCVADANVATRKINAWKVSGANSMYIAIGADFTATQTGELLTARGWTGAQGANRMALADIDFAPGDVLRIIVQSGQAGDDLSAITYSFKEML